MNMHIAEQKHSNCF